MKRVLFLLLLVSTTCVHTMYRPRKKCTAVVQHQEQSAHDFLGTMFEKTFNQIQDSFENLSQSERFKVLSSCGDAQPFLLIAHLPGDQRIEIVSYNLDADKKSAALFCSLPIKRALGLYKEKEEQAKRYSYMSIVLPLDFHYRTSLETCELIKKLIKSTKKEAYLTQDDWDEVYSLLEQDKWILTELGINSQFVYNHISQAEKLNVLATETKKIFNHPLAAHILYGNMKMMGYVVAQVSVIGGFFGLLEWIAPTNMFRAWFDTLLFTSKLSLKINICPAALIGVIALVKNYHDELNTLLERKKQYLC